MKVLVVGQGGREHALCWKLAQSPSVEEVFCAPGNAGTAVDATNVAIRVTDIEGIVDFAKRKEIGLTVVGPEAPLVAGLVDALRAEKLTVFGPTKAAAELEGSKAFAKSVMRSAGVPTGDWRTFTDADAAMSYLADREAEAVVVKADGLAAGKGVTVCKNRQEAREAVREIAVDRAFGEAGATFMLEECLSGQEASILAICDGRSILPLAPAQDHKPAGDGDTGPNTGGMGAYSPTPIVTEELLDEVFGKILVPTVHEMRKQKRTFTGVLYAGLMLTTQGPKVLEFNARFGDPEAQPVLMRLKSDLAEILLAAARGKLDQLPPLEWDPRPACCVVMASEGYPGDYEKGRVIGGLDEADGLPDTKVFHAGTTRVGDDVVTDGGRVLGVTALGDDVPSAKLAAYTAVKKIRWDGAWCRKDISDKAMPGIS
ncbi:MAG: phosphoribosylamine--glycine ligase [Planctomycetota bacterium]